MSTARAHDTSSEIVADVLPLEAPRGPRTLADRAFVELHDAILDARLEPGQRLRLDEVAASLGMSVMPVREALRRLEAARLVEVEPHRGATVSHLSAVELNEVFALRAVIESAAIARGAAEFEAADVAEAEAALAQYAEALDGAGYGVVTQTHVAFHLALYRARLYPWLIRTVMPLWETSSRYWNWVKREGWEADHLVDDHARLLRLCAERDADASAEEIRRHLMSGRDLLMRRVAAAAATTTVGTA